MPKFMTVPGDRVKIDPEVVILPEGQDYDLLGLVLEVEKLRATIKWDDGTIDDWYVGDLTIIEAG